MVVVVVVLMMGISCLSFLEINLTFGRDLSGMPLVSLFSICGLLVLFSRWLHVALLWLPITKVLQILEKLLHTRKLSNQRISWKDLRDQTQTYLSPTPQRRLLLWNSSKVLEHSTLHNWFMVRLTKSYGNIS